MVLQCHNYVTKWNTMHPKYLTSIVLVENCRWFFWPVFEHHFGAIEILAWWNYIHVHLDAVLYMGGGHRILCGVLLQSMPGMLNPLHGNHRGSELWRCIAASPWSIDAGDFLGHSVCCPHRPGGSKCRPEASFSTNGSSSGGTFS